MKRATLIAAFAALALLALGVGASSGGVHSSGNPRTIPAGFSLFQTDPSQNFFKFVGKSAIPAGFFSSDSKTFEGTVNFGGDPLITFQGQDVGNADTVVEREQISLSGDASPSDPVPVELRALSLISLQPIEVLTDSGSQFWAVRATLSPSRPSTGTIRVTQTEPNGGTFDSSVVVYPKFTFTRLSDSAVKELDVGALPDEQRPDDPITGDDSPWRVSCVAPALNVPSLNSGFCAGQRPGGGTTLTVETGPNLQHGIRPASARLEHFGCYSAPRGKGFKGRSVTLTDQFGRRKAKVGGGTLICNPARKNEEAAVVNKHDHLRCYRTNKGKPVGQIVMLANQLRSFAAEVRSPQALCLPSTKQVFKKRIPPKPSQRFRTDHFQCYAIRTNARFDTSGHLLRDQFGRRTVEIATPSQLCVPVRKNKTVVRNPVQHLVCYAVSPKRKVAKRLSIHNQFGREITRTRRAEQFCLPSLKVVREL
jgi:hypothetical protein